MNVSLSSRGLGVVLLLCLFCVAAPQKAQAQLVVSDPTNLYQNTTSALAEVQQTANSIRDLVNQSKQLAAQLQHLKELDVSDLDDLKRALGEVRLIAGATLQLVNAWTALAIEVKSTYGICGPPERFGGEGYPSIKDSASDLIWGLAAAWTCNSDNASHSYLEAQANIAKASSQIANQTRFLTSKAKAVQGTRDAAQLQARMEGVALDQRALMLDLWLKRGHAEEVLKMERRAKQRAATARQREMMGRYFGKVESTATPVTLPRF